MEQGDEKASQGSVMSRPVGEALNQCVCRIHSVLIRVQALANYLGSRKTVHKGTELSLYTLPVLE